VRMREITRSVKVALKCLIAIVLVNDDLPYWTSKVEHLVAFTAMFSNLCTAHAQKRLFMNFRCKFRHRRSIRRPRFRIKAQKFQRFGDVFRWFLHFICWMSAIFPLPGRLTYWLRKHATRVDNYVDNSHQVWSWYDHQQPSYSVLSADTSRDLVTLTFHRLTLNTRHTWRLTWPTLPPSKKTLQLSSLELWVIKFPVDYHWKWVRGHCACAISRDTWVGGQKQLHIWNPRPRFVYSLYNFYWATTTIKGRLLSSRPMLKPFRAKKF